MLPPRRLTLRPHCFIKVSRAAWVVDGDIDKFGRSRALRPWKPVDEYIGLIFAECVSMVVKVVTVGVVIGVRRLGTGLLGEFSTLYILELLLLIGAEGI